MIMLQDKDPNIPTYMFGSVSSKRTGQRGYLVRVESYRRQYETFWILLFLWLLCMSLFMLSACAHRTGRYVNRDFIDVQRGISYTIQSTLVSPIASQKDMFAAIRSGTEYWNTVAGKSIFREKTLGAEWIVEISSTRPVECSSVSLGCVIWTRKKIWISALETGDRWYLESIVRHEFGHLLGLDHTPGWSCAVVPELMCGVMIQPGNLHPLDAAKEDIETLKEIHPSWIPVGNRTVGVLNGTRIDF